MRTSDISFLIIGAAKCATTWLQESLQADPAVCMPDAEPHYFSRKYHLGESWYLSQFPRAAQHSVFGEKSNSYLECAAAPARIRSAFHNVKLVAQLRNPVERAYSDYCMLYRRGEVGKDIWSNLDPRTAAESRFLKGGMYHQQLQRYYDQFSEDDIMVLLYDDVEKAPNRQLSRVRSFIGLNGDEHQGYIQHKVKDKSSATLPPALRRVLRPLRPVISPFRATRPGNALFHLAARELRYPPFDEELRRRLTAYYSHEIEQLGQLLQVDLSSWTRDETAVVD
jgi:hypothetical protein